MSVIIVSGKASGQKVSFPFSNEDLSINLLTWLRSHGVMIASSCDGQKICRKCVIQNDWLTCSWTLGEFIRKNPSAVVEVSYL
jgi:hypothetical protein